MEEEKKERDEGGNEGKEIRGKKEEEINGKRRGENVRGQEGDRHGRVKEGEKKCRRKGRGGDREGKEG